MGPGNPYYITREKISVEYTDIYGDKSILHSLWVSDFPSKKQKMFRLSTDTAVHTPITEAQTKIKKYALLGQSNGI